MWILAKWPTKIGLLRKTTLAYRHIPNNQKQCGMLICYARKFVNWKAGQQSADRQNPKDKENTKQPKFDNEPIKNIGEVYGSHHVARYPLQYEKIILWRFWRGYIHLCKGKNFVWHSKAMGVYQKNMRTRKICEYSKDTVGVSLAYLGFMSQQIKETGFSYRSYCCRHIVRPLWVDNA